MSQGLLEHNQRFVLIQHRNSYCQWDSRCFPLRPAQGDLDLQPIPNQSCGADFHRGAGPGRIQLFKVLISREETPFPRRRKSLAVHPSNGAGTSKTSSPKSIPPFSIQKGGWKQPPLKSGKFFFSPFCAVAIAACQSQTLTLQPSGPGMRPHWMPVSWSYSFWEIGPILPPLSCRTCSSARVGGNHRRRTAAKRLLQTAIPFPPATAHLPTGAAR